MATYYRSIPFEFETAAFGSLVRSRRENAGLSQREVSDLLERSESWLSQLERGVLVHGLYMRDYVALCNLLDLNPSAFFSLAEGE